MTISLVKEMLLGCVIFNYAILLIWSGVFVFARNWMYRVHSRWFKLSDETFDALNYLGLAIYKIGILLFNLAPWIALSLVS
jgi:Family of unknown function (DUF6868)